MQTVGEMSNELSQVTGFQPSGENTGGGCGKQPPISGELKYGVAFIASTITMVKTHPSQQVRFLSRPFDAVRHHDGIENK